MEYMIGEIFEHKGEWYQCLKSDGYCNNCAGYGKSNIFCNSVGGCAGKIFKKIHKIGNPFYSRCPDGRIIHFQRYECYQKPMINENIICHWIDDTFIDIEIKQNEESMEEKTIKIKMENIKVGNKVICLSNNKPYVITEVNCRMKYNNAWYDCVIYTPLYDNPYKCFVRSIEDFAQKFVLGDAEKVEEKHSNLESTGKNLKPFDLQKAREGKPVCTRDGRKARIICFDKKEKDFPIVALIEGTDGQEYTGSRTKDGRIAVKGESNGDLMMLPEKKTGYINVYNKLIYNSEEDARDGITDDPDYVGTIKVEWEE